MASKEKILRPSSDAVTIQTLTHNRVRCVRKITLSLSSDHYDTDDGGDSDIMCGSWKNGFMKSEEELDVYGSSM